MLFHLVITVFEMKIILTCRITQYFNDAIGTDNDGWTFSVDEDYKIVDVDEDLLDEFMRFNNRELNFKIEADVELKQFRYTTCKRIVGCEVFTATVDDVCVSMKDISFIDGYLAKAHKDEVMFELDPDDNEDLINELELIETRGAA